MAQAAIASGIFSITFGLIVFRPRGIKEGAAGTLGAVLMLLAGLVGLNDVVDILRETGSILIMLLSMMVISIIVDEAGFFHWAASHSVRLSHGNGRRLFLNTFLMGAAVTTVISNDATALIITPIVYNFVSILGLNPLPFLLICTFIADTASLSLPVSNLTNLLVYDQLNLTFAPYVLSMALPTLVAILVNFTVFYIVFKKDIPKKFSDENLLSPNSYIKHEGFFKFSSISLVTIILAYIVGSWIGIPLVYISILGALCLYIVGSHYKQINGKKVFSQVSWSVIIFVIGMFIVVRGIQNTGLPIIAGNWLINQAEGDLLKTILFTSFGTALGSNIINNVPMDMMMISVIKSIPNNTWITPLGYATILGAGLGPNLTIIGSLATMLWLGTIRRKGVNITAGQYFKIGILTTPVMILTSGIALWLSLLIFGY